MKLVWHIVRKDLARLRGWLALWAVVLVAKIAFGWLVRSGTFVAEWKRIEGAVLALTWLDGAMTFLLVLLLVQEDPLVGTGLGWVTRPIAGGRLLAAKILGAAVALVGLPSLIALPWWLACGFGGENIVWAVAELALWQLAIALPAALVASLTDSLARAVLWTLVLAMAAMSTSAMWLYFVASQLGVENEELGFTRAASALAILALAMVAAIAWQFLARRLVRSLTVFGVGLALAVLASCCWPEQWMSRFQMSEKNAARAAGVTLTFGGAGIGGLPPGKQAVDRDVSIDLTARGVPDGMLLMGADFARHTWRWPDGLTLSREWWMDSRYWAGDDQAVRTALGLRALVADPETERVLDQAWEKEREATRELRQQQGLSPLLPRSAWWPPQKLDYVSLWGDVSVPASIAQRMRDQPPTYEGKIWLRLLQPEVWWETPLQPGGWLGHGAHRMRITRVTHEWISKTDLNEDNARAADQLRLHTVATTPLTLREDWWTLFLMRHERMAYYMREESMFCAINRTLGRLDGLRFDNNAVRICSVLISVGGGSVTVPKISRDGKWVDSQPPWREGATLVAIGWREEARFEREVKVERFEEKK